MRKTGVSNRSIGAAIIRCAIYTRKSSEEGLEQEFNSLDAQREACEAYILSQKSVGWSALPQMYDDGGISGGTMQRPALQRLLAEIGAGRVDTVVVYKVDRLTRSLSDFAKIVDAFDAQGVSFVSVTQQFNTTTSMGRLTLNMLLSFAQFEREVTGERIRDKIAASKQKGMWMGGLPPLGYDVAEHKLVINAREAETVRAIYRRYAALKSVRALKEDLDQAGITSKARADRLGAATGCKPLARGALYGMLQNRIYRGEIVHKDAAYPGLHEAIVDETLWNAVQEALIENRVERVTRSTSAAPSLLTGLVWDDNGERMSPTHANKKGTRYRYYVSQSLIKRGRTTSSGAGARVPASDLETLVENCITTLLCDGAAVADAMGSGPQSVEAYQKVIAGAADLAQRWHSLPASDRIAILQALIARIDVHSATVNISVRPAEIPDIVKPDLRYKIVSSSTASPDTRHSLPGAIPDRKRRVSLIKVCGAHGNSPIKVLSVPAQVKRTGMETKLVIQATTGSDRCAPDRSLLRLLGQARRFHTLVGGGEIVTVAALAAKVGVSRSYFTRVLRLSFLAPKITTAILEGRQPPELTANRLMQFGRLAPTWPAQRLQLGLG